VIECSDNVWEVYERLVEDWRRYDAMLWEIPFGTMTAVGAILTLVFHYIPSSEHAIRAALFIALAWFTLVMMHLSYKIRHFQIERSACIEAIECKCAKFAIPYDTKGAEKYVFITTEESRQNSLNWLKQLKRCPKILERWFYERRSYHLVYVMYIGMIYMLLTFALKELSFSIHLSILIHLRFAMVCAIPATAILIFIGLGIAWLFERN